MSESTNDLPADAFEYKFVEHRNGDSLDTLNQMAADGWVPIDQHGIAETVGDVSQCGVFITMRRPKPAFRQGLIFGPVNRPEQMKS